MAKFKNSCENPGGMLTALRTINTTNNQKKVLSRPPVISVMPAMNSPSTRLLVTTVHCTTASGSRPMFSSRIASATLASA